MTLLRRHRALGLAAVVLLLLAVAIASTGSVPAGSGGARRPADRVLDVGISLFMLLMLAGAALWVYVLWIRKDILAERAARRRARSPWASALAFVVGFGLLALFVRWLSLDANLRERLGRRVGAGSGIPATTNGSHEKPYDPQFATWPVVVVLVVLSVAACGWYLAHRAQRRRLPAPSPAAGPALADVLEETLDDLRAESDPRRAVIAAYARMERALDAYGLGRRPSEAPDEYLSRILAELEVSRRATTRLTALFAWAKFSGHDVAPAMKEEAIEALEAVRTELRAAEALAEQRRQELTAQLRERADA